MQMRHLIVPVTCVCGIIRMWVAWGLYLLQPITRVTVIASRQIVSLLGLQTPSLCQWRCCCKLSGSYGDVETYIRLLVNRNFPHCQLNVDVLWLLCFPKEKQFDHWKSLLSIKCTLITQLMVVTKCLRFQLFSNKDLLTWAIENWIVSCYKSRFIWLKLSSSSLEAVPWWLRLSIYSEKSCFFVCSLLVLALNTVSKSSFSLCLYVCIGLPGPANHPKVKYSLSAHTNKGKANGVQAIWENISLWDGLLVLEGQYIHTNREKMSF